MKKLIFAGLGLALFITGGVFAQNRTAEDGKALQQSLKEKAVRVPVRETKAAASEGSRTAPAQLRQRLPDWDAVRADLQRTNEEDAKRQTRSDKLSSTQAGTFTPPPGLRALASDRLANVEREEVDRVRIPLLLPAHPDVRDKLKVYGMENIYTATADIDENASLSITGTCNRVVGGDPNIVEFRKRLAEKQQRLTGAGAKYHISRNDFGVDLSFSKFGCGYVMTIECGNPADDQRCAADDYITMLADSMILANPERAGGE